MAKPIKDASGKVIPVVSAAAVEKHQKQLKNTKPENLPATKFNMTLMCGDCLHYRGSRHPNFDAPCATLGVGMKGEAPSCFTPDVTAFKSLSKDTFPLIASLVAAMSSRQSRVLMSVLKYAGTLERVGMTFLEECFFCLSSEQEAYLDDYCRGYVVGLNKTGGLIIVGTDFLQGSKNSMIAYLDKSSVLNEEQFRVRRKNLVDKGKIRKPLVARMEKKNLYIVPTIDDGPGKVNATAPGRRGRKGSEEPSTNTNGRKDPQFGKSGSMRIVTEI